MNNSETATETSNTINETGQPVKEVAKVKDDEMLIPKQFLKNDKMKSKFIASDLWMTKILKDLELESPQIISLSGDYGVGKDLWASFMKVYNPNVEIFHFADKLRKEFNRTGFTDEDIHRMKRSHNKLGNVTVSGYQLEGKTMREALIYVAETNKERFGVDYYAKSVIEKAMESFKQEPKTLVFVDCRFDVEHLALKKLAKDLDVVLHYKSIPEDLPIILPSNYPFNF